jgi:hypothetical protein
MRAEILQAIKAAALIEEQKSKLVVGTGRSRVPKDSEGNPTAAPIMIHFDAGKGSVFFRTSDDEGEPWGFEFPLPVAEALGLALNDLIGLFDAVESEKVASLEADVAASAAAANYFAEEKEIAEKKLEAATKRIEAFEHFSASVSGLWATDRPDLIGRVNVGEDVLFKIEPPEVSK